MQYVITYGNTAGVYSAQRDYEKALEYCEKELSIFEKRLGPEHPNFIIVSTNIESL